MTRHVNANHTTSQIVDIFTSVIPHINNLIISITYAATKLSYGYGLIRRAYYTFISHHKLL